MDSTEDFEGLKAAISETRRTRDDRLHNSHVVDWLFWEFKKDKVWYWFPFKHKASGVVDFDYKGG